MLSIFSASVIHCVDGNGQLACFERVWIFFREQVYGCLPESWLDFDSERLTAEASRDWSIIPMFTLCL